MDYADFALIADAYEAIPELIEAVKKDLASGGGGESETPDPLAPVDPRTGS